MIGKSHLARFLGILFLLFGLNSAYAWHIEGNVYCDANSNSSLDFDTDIPMGGVGVNTVSSGGTLYYVTTYNSGMFFLPMPDVEDDYTQTLDMSTLPGDAVVVQPPGGQYNFSLVTGNIYAARDWLIDSAICRPVVENKCWMTGGGVKFESITGTDMAEKGPRDSMGGNVFPSCSPEPGDGGQWNHISHANKLHFLGTTIETVNCGNVPGIEPGSESPVTPYNYIEYQGTGRLTGIKGNKVDHGTVYFFARVEDRNEPGSRGAKDGEDIDRYFIHVFSDPGNPAGSTLMLVDGDGDATTLDPITITGGNLQLHISSCDNPPSP